MKKNLAVIVVGVVVIGAAIGGGYLFGKHYHPASSKKTSSSSSTKAVTKAQVPTTNNTPSVTPKPSINTYDPAGLFHASESRKLTDFSPWQESGVTVNYVDYNGDGTGDAFVWAKIPGTKGNSFAAVWTIASDNQPQELWYVPSAQQLVQSSWSTSGVTFTETGSIDSPGGLDPQTNVYHWQGNTFVTY